MMYNPFLSLSYIHLCTSIPKHCKIKFRFIESVIWDPEVRALGTVCDQGWAA